MTEHDRVTDAETGQCGFKHRRLGFGRHTSPARAAAISETRPVETDHPIAACQEIDEAGSGQILDHGAIAVEQNNRRGAGVSAFEVVKAQARFVTSTTTTGARMPATKTIRRRASTMGMGAP